MKRTNTRSSTTATPSSRKFPLSPRGIAAVLASSTVVTFPTAAALLHQHGLATVLLVGLLPILPLAMLTVAFLASYMAVSTLAILVTVVRIVCGKADSDSGFDGLYVWITNAPIAFLTLTPLKVPARIVRSARSLSPLPPGAPGSARNQDAKIFWEVLQDMMAARPDGMPEIVRAGHLNSPPVRGRHEKVEAESRSGSRDSVSILST